MPRKNQFIRNLKDVPWLLVAIVFIWIIVFIIMGKRYLSFKEELNNNSQKSILVAESMVYGQLSDRRFNKGYLSAYPQAAGIISNRQIVFFDKDNNNQQINLSDEALYTPYGELHAVFDRSSGLYTLFFNQSPLCEVANPEVIYEFKLANKQIVLIFDAEVIQGDWTYSILEIGPKFKQLVDKVGNYERLIDAKLSSTGNCIYLKFADSRKYTESDNYQLFSYCNGSSPYKIIDFKPDSYYKDKFSKYSAKDVVNVAVKKGCLNPQKGEMKLNHECDYGQTYCYMYKALNPPPKNDVYYNLLNYACSNLNTRIYYEGIY